MIQKILLSMLTLWVMWSSVYTTVYAQTFDAQNEGKNDRFEYYFGEVIGPNLQDNIDLIWYEGQNDGQSVIDFIFDFLNNRVFPMLLMLSLVTVVFGCINFIFSESDESSKTATNYIIWWIVAIVLLVSINYIMGVLVGGDSGASTGSNADGLFEQFGRTLWFTDIYYEYDENKNGIRLVTQIYDRLIYPFIKFLSYLLIGILFTVLLINVFKYISSGDDDSMQKKSMTICINAIIGILLIVSAKFVVQFIYGVQEKVLRKNITNLSQMGGQIAWLDSSSVSNTQLIFNYLNRGLSFLAFIIVILIIANAYKLLFAGWDDAEALSNTKKYFLYLALGLVLIGMSYMIINFLIVK